MLNFGCVKPSAPPVAALTFVLCVLGSSHPGCWPNLPDKVELSKKRVIWWWKPILSYQAHDIHDASYQKGRKDRILPVETFICSEIGLIWWWRIIIAYRLYPGFILAGQFLPGTWYHQGGQLHATNDKPAIDNLATSLTPPKLNQKNAHQGIKRSNRGILRTSVVLFLPTINLSK